MLLSAKASRNGTKSNKGNRIREVSIIGGFLDGAEFNLVNGLNCFIGARGTGKTTALEFIRYAIDALPAGDSPERRRIDSLVERNLAGGRVQMVVETADGMTFTVSRSAGEDPMVLNEDGKPTELSLKSTARFKANIFSQNEVEELADRYLDQLTLIDNFAADRIREIDANLRRLERSLDANTNQIMPLKEARDTLTEELRSLPEVENKLKSFAAIAGNHSGEINSIQTQKALRERERIAIESYQEFLQSYAAEIEDARGQVPRKAEASFQQEILSGPNRNLTTALMERAVECGRDVDRLLKGVHERIQDEAEKVGEIGLNLARLHKQQELAYRGAIEKHRVVQGQAAERMRWENLRNDLLAKQRLRDDTTKKLERLKTERTALFTELSELRDARFAVRCEIADGINKHLSPAIRVGVFQCGNPSNYRRMLEEMLKSARIKHGRVAEKLAACFSPQELSKAVRTGDSAALISKADISEDQAEKVIATLRSDFRRLLQMEAIEIYDKPCIELKDGDAYKDLSELSTGQKCTAILPILLLDSETPLLVDQPEDNLDNRFIYASIVDSIRKIKKRRQLIFVTHNPNIPVLGDADRIFVLDSNGEASHIANEGTVDECRHEIITLLEGGEDAFKARKDRYQC